MILLRRSFIHIPRIGPLTERLIWQSGVTCWDDCLRAAAARVRPNLRAHLLEHVEVSRERLESGDARHFQAALGSLHAWRLYDDFRERTAYLDIETTGLSFGPDEITVIGVYDGEEAKTFVKGRNLDAFPREICRYSLLVTFNGAGFDLPFLRTRFPDFDRELAHIDLLHVMRRLGYRGGLKRIERELGLGRPEALHDLDGYCAVLLWHRHLRGRKHALETLLRYNLEDVVSLERLAQLAYNLMLKHIPIPVEEIPLSARPAIPHSFDESLVHEVARQSANRYWR